MKKISMIALCVFLFAACASQTENNQLKSVLTETSESTILESELIYNNVETNISESCLKGENFITGETVKLDFDHCKKPNDNSFIISDKAENLTIEKLYSLISMAKEYMTDGKEFFRDENYKETGIYNKDLNSYKQERTMLWEVVFTNRLINTIPEPDYNSKAYVYSMSNVSASEYGYGGDRGKDETYMDSDWQINVISDTEIQLIHQAFYSLYPEWIEGDESVYFNYHALLNQNDDSVHQLRTLDNRSERLETYYYTLLWEDNHWKFDQFALWY